MYLEKQTAVICGVSVLSAFIIGIIIGTFAINNTSPDNTSDDAFENKEFVAEVMDKVDTQKLRTFLEILTKEPHIAASDRDRFSFTFLIGFLTFLSGI